MDWKPISTAPERGPYLVFGRITGSLDNGDWTYPCDPEVHLVDQVFVGDDGRPGRFMIDRGENYDYGYATHWRPIPEPPSVV